MIHIKSSKLTRMRAWEWSKRSRYYQCYSASVYIDIFIYLVLGFVLGNLASSYVSTPKAKEKAASDANREAGKPLDSKPMESTTTSDVKSQGIETDEIKPTMESFM